MHWLAWTPTQLGICRVFQSFCWTTSTPATSRLLIPPSCQQSNLLTQSCLSKDYFSDHSTLAIWWKGLPKYIITTQSPCIQQYHASRYGQGWTRPKEKRKEKDHEDGIDNGNPMLLIRKQVVFIQIHFLQDAQATSECGTQITSYVYYRIVCSCGSGSQDKQCRICFRSYPSSGVSCPTSGCCSEQTWVAGLPHLTFSRIVFSQKVLPSYWSDTASFIVTLRTAYARENMTSVFVRLLSIQSTNLEPRLANA